MRKIEYLSPSSINLFYKSPKDFYLRYLTENRPPRDPQTQPMSVGSAFDAYVKSYLHEALFGKGADPKYELKTLFEAQVEEHNRDFAWKAGQYCFNCYKSCGALVDLALELENSIGTPQFEIELKGAVEGYREGVTRDVQGVVLLGKPDVFYTNPYGCPVILDFKVNGFCSKYTTSPMKGYTKLRVHGTPQVTQHKNCMPVMFRGMMINGASFLEDLNRDWAVQLSVYAWLSGVRPGEEFIVAIDQLACDGQWKKNIDDFPIIRIAEHRMKVQSKTQYEIFSQIQYVWECVQSGHFFREMSKEESDAMCATLDQVGKDLNVSETDNDRWFNERIR